MAVDVRDRSYEALVLKAKNYREQDRLLTLVSLNNGPELAIARGARKAGSSLAGLSQPFGRVQLTLSPAKNTLSFVREGWQEESFLPPGGDVARFAYLSYVSELTLTAWPPARPAPELYGLLLAVFKLLKLDDDLPRTARLFELRLLRCLGLLPDLSAPPQSEGRFCLSPTAGALLTAAEADAAQDPAPRLSNGARLTLLRLLDSPLPRIFQLRLSATIGRELEQALEFYLAYHLEYAGPAKRILKQLL